MSISNGELSTLLSPSVIGSFFSLPAGRYYVDYADSTHMAENEWNQLLSIDLANSLTSITGLSDAEFLLDASEVSPSYTVKAEPIIKTNTGANPATAQADENVRAILDQLAQCFVRAGILMPFISSEIARKIVELQKQKSVLIIPDTNALSNGSLHWLISALPNTSTQLIPIAISMHQIQEHDRRLKSLVNKRKPANFKPALRSRSLANNALAMLDLCPQNYQVLEVPAELLRYVRPASGKPGEQDETDVLEDRLLIEAIHQILRSTRSKSPKLVVTADVTLSRILHSEAIPFLSLLVPIIDAASSFSSINFDPLTRKFRGASLPQLLWTLLQTFSEIRLRTDSDNECLKMSLYWPSKTVDDWIAHKFLFLATPQPSNTTTSNIKGSGTESSASLDNTPPPNSLESNHFNNLSAPNISLLPTIELAGICEGKSYALSELLDVAEKTFEMSESQTKNAGEFLIQANFAVFADEIFRPTNLVASLAECLEQGDLDALSVIFEENFQPYALLKQVLKDSGALPYEMNETIRNLWKGGSKVAFRNLRLFLVYLGQAWTVDGAIVDGSQRLSDEDFISNLLDVFHDRDFLSMKDLIVGLSIRLKMSPWAVKQKFESVSSSVQLMGLRFDPATASEVIYGDKVLRGPLAKPTLEPLVMNSVYVGGKPIFTVARA